MARSRVPKPYAIIQLVLHICCLTTSLIASIFLIYISATVHKSYVWSYVALVLPIILDTCEVVAIADYKRTIGRLHPGATIALEVVTMGLIIWAIFAIIFDDWGEHRSDYIDTLRVSDNGIGGLLLRL
ncbi:hypothetical protein DL98DRAFT_589362 [Cadophora sp. DSE1049]|nr:hypothetical protein DL98DRAFT_589362 [Cadophora sp. DSE1049]